MEYEWIQIKLRKLSIGLDLWAERKFNNSSDYGIFIGD
jgi:hypothetical protein